MPPGAWFRRSGSDAPSMPFPLRAPGKSAYSAGYRAVLATGSRNRPCSASASARALPASPFGSGGSEEDRLTKREDKVDDQQDGQQPSETREIGCTLDEDALGAQTAGHVETAPHGHGVGLVGGHGSAAPRTVGKGLHGLLAPGMAIAGFSFSTYDGVPRPRGAGPAPGHGFLIPGEVEKSIAHAMPVEVPSFRGRILHAPRSEQG